MPASTIARALGVPRSSLVPAAAGAAGRGLRRALPGGAHLRARAAGERARHVGAAGDAAVAARPAARRPDRARARRCPPWRSSPCSPGRTSSTSAPRPSSRAPTTVARVGVRLPAHLTATGRAMLSRGLRRPGAGALPAPRGPHHAVAGSGPATLAELDGILRAARDRGWAAEEGEITDGYASVAATAVDRNGYPAAAIGLTYRTAAADDPAASHHGRPGGGRRRRPHRPTGRRLAAHDARCARR